MPSLPSSIVSAVSPDHNVAGPVRAVIDRTPAGIRLRLIGEAAHGLSLRYSLTSVAGGNHAVQSGKALLAPGVPQTLLDLSQSVAGRWGGTLDVTVEGGGRFHADLAVSG